MRKLFIIIFLFFLILETLHSQSGIRFLEFAKRLEPYFDESMIEDIRIQLPDTRDYFIWGYDVGDFSGDGNNDVALTLRMAQDRSRNMQVYLFVDIDGYFRLVHQETLQFIELPLEVGAAINDGKAYITKKNMQYNWDIYGYSFQNGNLILHDVFQTRRLEDLTYESYRNYNELSAREKYITLKNNRTIIEKNFLILPSYHRGRVIYSGMKDNILVNSIDNLLKGAYWWKDENDCSYNFSSAYDDEFIYFTVEVTDDSVVPQNCDTCIADHIQLWFDINNYNDGDRYVVRKGNKISARESSKKGIYKFLIYTGDFVNLAPYCKVITTEELNNDQKYEAKNIKVVSNLTKNGYIVKFKIPFSLLGINSPKYSKNDVELGFSLNVIDYDNEFRPEEFSELVLGDFRAFDTTTFSILKFIKENEWYGVSNNIFLDEIVKNLLKNGF